MRRVVGRTITGLVLVAICAWLALGYSGFCRSTMSRLGDDDLIDAAVRAQLGYQLWVKKRVDLAKTASDLPADYPNPNRKPGDPNLVATQDSVEEFKEFNAACCIITRHWNPRMRPRQFEDYIIEFFSIGIFWRPINKLDIQFKKYKESWDKRWWRFYSLNSCGRVVAARGLSYPVR